MKYLTLTAALLITACASRAEKIETSIETYNIINGSYCKDGNVPKWFHNGENYYFITCSTGQTFSIKKD